MKKIIALLLCCCTVLCFSGCGKTGGGTANGNTQGSGNPKKFSDEAEFKKYTNDVWVCEGKSNDNTTFKLRLFNEENGHGWDFSYPANETLEDCIKNVLKLNKEQGKNFKGGMEFLFEGLNVDGFESKRFDIEYDVNKGQINSGGQTYGIFLSDGTFKCDGDIYKTNNDKVEGFFKDFMAAKVSLFNDEYGELATYKDVKYNPISYLGKKFMLTGTAELDDYYNFDYRNFESVYFCICVTPPGGGYADRWYIYGNRNQYSDLFEELKNGEVSNIVLICSSYYPDSLQEEMANLVDYCYY